MDEAKRIYGLLRTTYEERPWHGLSLKTILSGVDAEMASARSVRSAHTIWEDVLHIEAWMEITRLRLGGQAVDATPERDWPAVGEITEEAWRRAVGSLDMTYRNLMNDVGTLKPEDLERPIAGKNYDAYTLLHGVINHNVYHSAQISLLKKELSSHG